MVKIIDGRKIAERAKDKIARDIFLLNGPRPNLAIILVGERADSKLYVSLKEREGKKIGVDTHLYALDEKVAEEELLSVIDFLNKDESIDGILVQLPLPKNFNTDRVIAAIDPNKDVDGFHPQHPAHIVSPVFAAVSACIDDIKLSGQNKTACLMYNSEIFGSGLEKLLLARGFSIVSKTEMADADLIVTALGEPHKIKKEMVKDGVAVIDIGITKVEDKVLGDADFEDLKEKAAHITPVPGGIGPMTIAFLFKNVWEIFRRKSEEHNN